MGSIYLIGESLCDTKYFRFRRVNDKSCQNPGEYAILKFLVRCVEFKERVWTH